MPYKNRYADAFKTLNRIGLNAPPVSIVALALQNEKGVTGAYIDPTTGLLVNAAGVPVASTLASQSLIAGDVAIPVASGTYLITKGSLAALTLAAPTAAQAGTKITVNSTTAFAHTITATTLINDGATGVPHTTATFAAFSGASITLEAYNGLWQVTSNNHVTVS